MPEGSRPTWLQRLSPCLPSASVSRKTLEMLWIEKGSVGVAGGMDRAVEGDDREAEAARVDAGELRDVVGDLALAEARRELGMDLVDDRLQVGGGVGAASAAPGRGRRLARRGPPAEEGALACGPRHAGRRVLGAPAGETGDGRCRS